MNKDKIDINLASNISWLINVLELFSVVFAQQKEGFFIGWSQPLSGSGDLEVDITTSEVTIPQFGTVIPVTTTTDTPDVDFEGGYGIKAGYNFSQFRVYYSLIIT